MVIYTFKGKGEKANTREQSENSNYCQIGTVFLPLFLSRIGVFFCIPSYFILCGVKENRYMTMPLSMTTPHLPGFGQCHPATVLDQLQIEI